MRRSAARIRLLAASRPAALAAPLLLTLGLVAAALAAAEPDSAGADASEDYVLHCSACHTLDGTGAADFVPTLRGIGALLDVPGGREYLAQVPGVAQAPLSDARLARLLDWVLLTFSGAAPEPPYAAAEVGALRASPLRDPGTTRRALAALLSRPSKAARRVEEAPAIRPEQATAADASQAR